MVVTATAEKPIQLRGELRPMDPARDLGSISNLIATAFAHELDARGQAAVREMRWMARFSPLIWWWAQADPSFADTFNGFVWEEPDPTGRRRHIVGNVSLNRAPSSRQHWIVCNVVVQDQYQRRGIGQQLTAAAVAEAQALGAEGVILQAYQDNQPALRLYGDLGFREVAGEVYLGLEAAQPATPVDAPGYHLRPWRPPDGQAAFELARRATALEQQWMKPIRAGKYCSSRWACWAEKLTGLISGRQVYRLVALWADMLVALITVTATTRRGHHQLDLLIHPDHAGRVEVALVSRALYMLAAIPPRPVRATVATHDRHALDALHRYGFREERTLLTLRKDFR